MVSCIQNNHKSHKKQMHKQTRNYFNNRKNTYLKDDFFHKIIVLYQYITSCINNFREIKPWNHSSHQPYNIRNIYPRFGYLCSCIQSFVKDKPIYNNRNNWLNKWPYNTKILSCKLGFKIIFREVQYKFFVF